MSTIKGALENFSVRPLIVMARLSLKTHFCFFEEQITTYLEETVCSFLGVDLCFLTEIEIFLTCFSRFLVLFQFFRYSILCNYQKRNIFRLNQLWLNEVRMWHPGKSEWISLRNCWFSKNSQYPRSKNFRDGIRDARYMTEDGLTPRVPIILSCSKLCKWSAIFVISLSEVCRWAVKKSLTIFGHPSVNAFMHPVEAWTPRHQPTSNSWRFGAPSARKNIPLSVNVGVLHISKAVMLRP